MRTDGRRIRWCLATVLGAACATVAQAQDTGGGLLSSLGSLFSSSPTTTSTPSTGATSALLSRQQSVVASSIQQNAAQCATGTQPGTIGYAIQQAQNVHLQLASVRPNTDQLFQAGNGCFGGLSQLFDLSDTIPSLGSIMSAAAAAVEQYATQRICQAVNQVTSSVTTPLNQAISSVTATVSTSGIDGMIGQQMSSIDPNLGSAWNANSPGGSYSINTNAFNINQTSFSPGTGMGPGPSTSSPPPSPPSPADMPVRSGPSVSTTPPPPKPPQDMSLVGRLQSLIH